MLSTSIHTALILISGNNYGDFSVYLTYAQTNNKKNHFSLEKSIKLNKVLSFLKTPKNLKANKAFKMM